MCAWSRQSLRCSILEHLIMVERLLIRAMKKLKCFEEKKGIAG
jgi:hypothetical protein